MPTLGHRQLLPFLPQQRFWLCRTTELFYKPSRFAVSTACALVVECSKCHMVSNVKTSALWSKFMYNNDNSSNNNDNNNDNKDNNNSNSI